jgi:hypothetical protein
LQEKNDSVGQAKSNHQHHRAGKGREDGCRYENWKVCQCSLQVCELSLLMSRLSRASFYQFFGKSP